MTPGWNPTFPTAASHRTQPDARPATGHGYRRPTRAGGRLARRIHWDDGIGPGSVGIFHPPRRQRFHDTSFVISQDGFSCVREAFGSLAVAGPAWLVCIALAAAIPVWVSEPNEPAGLVLLFAWLWHLGVAGMALIGFIPVAIHAWTLSSMLNGLLDGPRALLITFHTQLFTSAGIMLCMAGTEHWWKSTALIAWSIAYFARRWLASRLIPLFDLRQTTPPRTTP